MFTADNIFIDISLDEIYKYVSQYDIWKKYCTNFQEVNKPFLSEFYKDKNPDCRIFYDRKGNLIYKDFGELDHYFNCFYYIMFKYGCSYKEALRVVSKDFDILKINNNYRPKILEIENKQFSNIHLNKINIIPRDWNLYDYKYWFNQYSINFEDLDEDGIIPCRNMVLTKNDRTITFTNTNENPIYAYKEYDWESNEFLGYKIYTPLNSNKNFKFIACNNISKSIINWNKLPEKGDLLLITKSRKDRLCCKKLSFDSIATQNEGMFLPEKLAENIKSRFKKILILFDNDEQGIKSANKIQSLYGFKCIFIPLEYECKDISELIAKIGLKEAKKVLNKLINERLEKNT